MPRLKPGDRAPLFELRDTDGNLVRLSELIASGDVLLVLNRGFS